ncbi:membrane protein, suppressor for copper-sensitivity ScsB [Klebsiella pneumoniae]|nr:membrane protein, suppressor for copper-sensitivity ScsB [Klebsiella pneumoniae]
MYMVFRRLLVCLLWLWLPVSQAADSGWLRAADNQHASVRLRAQTESNGDTRLLLDVALEKGWKTYWRSPGGRRHRAGYRLAHAAGGELALADAAALRRRGHFHSGVPRRRQLPDDPARQNTADA